MRLALVQPPIADFYDTDIRLQPLGLALLKAVVRERLPEVEVLIRDFHHGHGRQSAPLPPELAHVRDYYAVADASPFASFHSYRHFGASFAAIADEVAALRPDFVGVSCLFTPYFREALACAKAIREKTGVPILLGGAHVTAVPESVLAEPYVDYVIRGEGERPLVELLTRLSQGRPLDTVPNLGWKDQGRLVMNPLQDNYPLAELPHADFSDLPPARYRLGKRTLCSLTLSRGCPHGCSFCSVRQTFGRVHRSRTAEDVLAEIALRRSQGYDAFDFEDDNLSFDRASFHAVLRGLAERYAPGDIECVAMNGVSHASLDRETLTLMRQAGFSRLNLALVSVDRTVLDQARRSHRVEDFVRVASEAATMGFSVTAYQILGLPPETPASMVATMALLARTPVLLGASIFYLTPGAPIANQFPPQGPADYVRARSTAMAIEYDDVRREDLSSLFVTARIVNFLKGIAVPSPRATLSQALRRAHANGGRDAQAATILTRLFREDRLHAATRQGLVPLPKFKPALLRQVLTQTAVLRGLQGADILCDPEAMAEAAGLVLE